MKQNKMKQKNKNKPKTKNILEKFYKNKLNNILNKFKYLLIYLI